MFLRGAKAAIILLFILCALEGCVTVSAMSNDKENSPLKLWHDAPREKIQAVVVLLHGLNLKPSRMDDWSSLLTSRGAHVIRFALYGHTGDLAHMRDASADMWRRQFKDAMEHAKKIAAENNVPLYFIGFSLGALVALEWLSSQDDKNFFDKMVLIAPAISVPWYSRFAIKTASLFGLSMLLPSRSPESYRANKGTSVAAYLALFALKDSLEAKKYKNANVKTLILIDRNDELVDSRDVSDAINQYKLSNWSLEIVNNRFAYDNYGFRHLMVDQEAVGKELWTTLGQKVLKHFELNDDR